MRSPPDVGGMRRTHEERSIPMKRCETRLVQWDYNFDSLAHYGLLPDFFHDLTNRAADSPAEQP